MLHIVHDIETSPAPHREAWVSDHMQAEDYPGPPGNYKSEAAKAKHLAAWQAEARERAETAWGRTALDARHGEVVCICAVVCSDNGTPLDWFRMDRRDELPEAELLRSWWVWAGNASHRSRSTWVGHYASTFDLPFLFRRSWILGVRTPAPPSGWNDITDTRDLWRVTKASRDHVKLRDLATAFGLADKLEDDRYPHAWEAAVAGDWAWVMDRCRSDVEITHAAWCRMTGRGS